MLLVWVFVPAGHSSNCVSKPGYGIYKIAWIIDHGCIWLYSLHAIVGVTATSKHCQTRSTE